MESVTLMFMFGCTPVAMYLPKSRRSLAYSLSLHTQHCTEFFSKTNCNLSRLGIKRQRTYQALPWEDGGNAAIGLRTLRPSD